MYLLYAVAYKRYLFCNLLVVPLTNTRLYNYMPC